MNVKPIKTFGAAVCICCVFISCKKTTNEKVPNKPVFYATANDGTDVFELNGGSNNYYVFSGTGVDSLGIPYVYSFIASKDSSLENSLEFRFRANQIKTKEELEILSLLKVKHFNLFAKGQQKVSNEQTIVRMYPQNLETGVAHLSWMHNGNVVNQGVLSFEMDTIKQKSFTVRLVAQMTDGCHTYLEKSYVLNKNQFFHSDFSIDETVDQGTILLSSSNPFVPEMVNWYENEDFLGTGNFISLDELSIGTRLIRAEIKSPDGITLFVTRNLTVDENETVLNCPANMTMNLEEVMVPDVEQFGSVEIIYRDSKAAKYSTIYNNNPGGVQIEAVEDYINDREGRPTKRVLLSGNFRVANLQGNVKRFNNFSGAIAIAY